MALTSLQLKILRLLAERRKRGGESYVAGDIALNQALQASRLSRDIDLFHDTDQALLTSWSEDRRTLCDAGYTVAVIREVPAFIEASVIQDNESVLIQWVRDSAFRFFPLITDELFGLTLHPLDLAANKLLALVGRLEPRDWVDMLACHATLQPLGYLTWAACGKDPGFSPEFLLDAAARQHYPQAELDLLAFDGPPPVATTLGAAWKSALAEARNIIQQLPEATVGHCLLTPTGQLYRGTSSQLAHDLDHDAVRFHGGTIGGVWPIVKSPNPFIRECRE